MSKLFWDESLATGDREIDTHHKAFISQAQRLATACRIGEGTAETGKMLEFLAQYAQHHFCVEEQRMRSVDYPYITTHLSQHEEFNVQLDKLRARFSETGPTDELADAVQEMIIEWLIRHVRGTDMPMIEFLRKQNP